MGYRFKLFWLLVIPVFPLKSQSVLEQYVQEGLKNNPEIKQQELALQRMSARVKEYGSYFFPSVGIEARYSRAGGGRTIEFPVGDLLNPVYEGMQGLALLHGIQVEVPHLENETIPFLREKEHETKLRTIQPVFNPAIYYQYKMGKKESEIQRLILEIKKKDLARDIVVAYYRYLQSLEIIKMYEQALITAQYYYKSLVSLYRNGKITTDNVYRARAELQKYKQELSSAKQKSELAKNYFNTLLNRNLNEEIIIDAESTDSIWAVNSAYSLLEGIESKREELLLLKTYEELAQLGLKISRSEALPKINAVLDYGYQGEKYSFTDKDDYYMLSILLSWNLFHGFNNRYKNQQQILNMQELEASYESNLQKIKLEVLNAYQNWNHYMESRQSYRTATQAAEKNLHLVQKKLENGLANILEFTDAMAAYTRARSEEILNHYQMKMAEAQLKRSLGLYYNQNF